MPSAPTDASTVVALARRFSLTGLAVSVVLFPFTFAAGYDLGLSATTRLVTMALFVVLMGAGAVVPWQRMLQLRLGRAAFDLQALLTVSIVCAVIARDGPMPSASLAVLMIAAFAAVHVTRAGLVSIIALVTVTGLADILRASSSDERIVAVSILTVTLILIAMTRTTATALRRSIAAETALRRAADERASRLEAVGLAARSLATYDPQTILDCVAATTQRLGWDLCGVYVEEEPGGRLRYAAHHNLPTDAIDQSFPRDVGAAGQVLARRDTVVIEDYADNAIANRLYASRGLQTVVGVPIVVDGELGGVIVVGRHERVHVEPSDVHALELLAAQAGRAVEMALRHQEQAATIAELRALDGMKNDFLATVSHELRTPLTVILGLSKVLDTRRDALTPELLDQMIRRLRRNATGLDEIISTLLDVGRLEAGRMEMTVGPVNLADVGAEILERLRPLLEHHEVVADWTTEAVVEGDRMLLGRVVENLLANAARHTPPGTTVTVAVREVHGSVQVSIDDDGPGIAPDDLARLGERFFRGGDPAQRPTRGMGLGLAFCREVLRLHDTDLQVESRPGRGTTFSFALAVADLSHMPGRDVSTRRVVSPP